VVPELVRKHFYLRGTGFTRHAGLIVWFGQSTPLHRGSPVLDRTR
jgi:hypothetical protein